MIRKQLASWVKAVLQCHMRLTKLALTAALTAGLAVVPAIPANAIGGPNTLTVIAYYGDSGKQTLVGQRWSGCGGPGGEWGDTTSYVTMFFPPC